MRTLLLAAALAAVQTVPPRPATPPTLQVPPAPAPAATKSLERSPYFAFVDRDYIFTVEMVKPGVPLLNFVSMADKERMLAAKQVRLALQNRKVAATFFLVDTGNPKEPVIVPSVRMRPRSSFGVRLQGEFGQEAEMGGAVIGVAEEDLTLVPLTSLDFENLALKINRLNLGSPDFRDDWRVLKLDTLGDRAPARRVRVAPQN